MLRAENQAIAHSNIIKQLETKQKTLFSITTSIDPFDPVVFYKQSTPNTEGKRFFWKSANEDFYLVGVGATLLFSNLAEKNRFDEIHQFWKDIVQNATIEGSSIIGTGPLLFGGFSFDPDTAKEQEWSDFGDTFFYLPKYMLTIVNGQHFLTFNQIMDPAGENKTSLYKHIEEYMNDLLARQSTVAVEQVSITSCTEIGQAEWVKAVEEIVNLLKSTDIKKVVLARKMIIEFSKSPSIATVLEQLRRNQPGSFTFALESGSSCFLGASPERLVKKTGEEVLSTCLAGSAPRSKDPGEDEWLGKNLLNDAKNRYEHQLVVNMIKNALNPICTNLIVPEEPILMKTPAIQHLYTPITGKAKAGQSIFKMVERLHPTPALGGVPTIEALKIIREKEKMDRGLYAGPIGWTDFRGNGEFIVGIRSGLIQNNNAILYAGCGLVPDSNPQDELIETRIKFRPMLHALGGEEK